MKLIVETIENIEVLKEETNGQNNYYIHGIFMQAECKNRNNRVYPRAILEREAQRYIKENVTQSRAFGELGHPAGPTINLDRVSHIIKELHQDGNNFIGKAKILDTPYGKIVKNLIDEGAKLGVSTRGMGNLRLKEGVNYVTEDFYLATAGDIVADPSAPEAFVNGVMEGVEWICESGIWKSKTIEDAQKAIKEASSKELEGKKLQVFKKLLEGMEMSSRNAVDPHRHFTKMDSDADEHYRTFQRHETLARGHKKMASGYSKNAAEHHYHMMRAKHHEDLAKAHKSIHADIHGHIKEHE